MCLSFTIVPSPSTPGTYGINRYAPGGPLFTYLHKGTSKFLDYSTFSKTLTKVLKSCGYDADDYSGHSLRRGGATFAYKLGLPPKLLKLQGDWRSDCWERYVHIPLEMHWNFAVKLAQGSLNQQ